MNHITPCYVCLSCCGKLEGRNEALQPSGLLDCLLPITLNSIFNLTSTLQWGCSLETQKEVRQEIWEFLQIAILPLYSLLSTLVHFHLRTPNCPFINFSLSREARIKKE
nr:hypothetical protein Iba_chr13bCG15710 [Ipomoea batatas]